MGKLNVQFPKNIVRFESAMKKRFSIKSILYKDFFGGKGFEFDYHRKYSEGDDASLIDWKATLRSENVLVKKFVEEKDLRVFFIIDVGDNMILGSGGRLKGELAAEVVACIAHLIIISGNSVGFNLYGENSNYRRMFSTGIKQFYILEKNLKDSKNYGGKSDLGETLKSLVPYLKNTSAVFLISDFINISDKSLNVLEDFSKRYETIGLMIRDPVDVNLPNLKREVIIEDINTGRQLLINPGLIRHEYARHAHKQKKNIEDFFKKINSDLLNLYTDKDFIMPLTKFLKLRTKSRKYVSFK